MLADTLTKNINGPKMTKFTNIIFERGMLANKDFDIYYFYNLNKLNLYLNYIFLQYGYHEINYDDTNIYHVYML